MTVSPNTSALQPKKKHFISLRIRLLVGFTVIFTGVFASAYYWFYTFTIGHAVERLRADANSTLTGAAEGVDVDELLDLYANGEPNAEGFSNDPRYLNQMEWLMTVQQLEPRAWPYTYIVVGDANLVRRQSQDGSVETSPPQDLLEVIGLVDLWAIHDPRKSYRFLESDRASTYTLSAWTEGRLVERPDIYRDEWGEWITSYIPLRDSDGTIVAMMGLDIEASYVTALKSEILHRLSISFVIVYGSLFVLVYIVSSYLTKPLKNLGLNAQLIANAEYNNLEGLSDLTSRRFTDEFSELAHVFQVMVLKVKGREEALKSQVKVLKIEIDEARKHKEVSEIVNSDFFQDLQAKALVMRKRMNRELSPEEDNI